jgi:hypothetical protein
VAWRSDPSVADVMMEECRKVALSSTMVPSTVSVTSVMQISTLKKVDALVENMPNVQGEFEL